MPKLRTISVAKLIDLLEGEDPNAQVIFSTDYGDYHHTAQALPIRGEFEEALVEESAYSNSGFALASDDADQDDEENEGRKFLVLR